MVGACYVVWVFFAQFGSILRIAFGRKAGKIVDVTNSKHLTHYFKNQRRRAEGERFLHAFFGKTISAKFLYVHDFISLYKMGLLGEASFSNGAICKFSK